MANWIEGKVVENIQWHSRLFSLRVEATLAPFAAGQFTKLALEHEGQRTTRAYSFVNSPEQPIHEFYYITVEQGSLSPQLAQLKPGDPVLVAQQPTGFFTLNEVPDAKSLWLLSTGTAIGPYLSMLQTANLVDRFEKIVLVHCVRQHQDLSYRAEIEALVDKFKSRLVYVPIVTREPNSKMLSTRIPAAITSGQLANYAQVALTPEESQVMICGNPEMVKATQQLLLSLGFSKNLRRTPGNITVENYW